MSDQVSWIIELTVKPGQLETFKTLRDEMVDGTGLENGTVGYEWSISADETPCTSMRPTPTLTPRSRT